jgi:hypothetical protein
MSEDLFKWIDTFRIMGWSLLNGPKILSGTSSRNTEPISSIVKMTTWTWRRKTSGRSAQRTRTDVGIAQWNWTIHFQPAHDGLFSKSFTAFLTTNHRLRWWITWAVFNTQRKEPRVCVLLGNSSQREITDRSPTTAHAAPNAGKAPGASFHDSWGLHVKTLEFHHGMCVDCELLEVITVGEDLAESTQSISWASGRWLVWCWIARTANLPCVKWVGLWKEIWVMIGRGVSTTDLENSSFYWSWLAGVRRPPTWESSSFKFYWDDHRLEKTVVSIGTESLVTNT